MAKATNSAVCSPGTYSAVGLGGQKEHRQRSPIVWTAHPASTNAIPASQITPCPLSPGGVPSTGKPQAGLWQPMDFPGEGGLEEKKYSVFIEV